jgi:hypothetical protein
MEVLIRGEHGMLVGLLDNKLATTPLSNVVGRLKPPDLSLLDMAEMLSK